jgi:hypothetical protein
MTTLLQNLESALSAFKADGIAPFAAAEVYVEVGSLISIGLEIIGDHSARVYDSPTDHQLVRLYAPTHEISQALDDMAAGIASGRYTSAIVTGSRIGFDGNGRAIVMALLTEVF